MKQDDRHVLECLTIYGDILAEPPVVRKLWSPHTMQLKLPDRLYLALP